MENRYAEGLKILEDTCGNGKDNIISLATINTELSTEGNSAPCTRDVDAHYEDGVFYVTTWLKSNKMEQILKNKEVAFSVPFEGISGSGIGENLGWVLDPKNADLRLKLRKTFAEWYDYANNEESQNCIILGINIKRLLLFREHGALKYDLDMVNKVENTEN